ncbi:MAG: T9SS type A sorting domain-containing protein [Bacteroidota bacterium]
MKRIAVLLIISLFAADLLAQTAPGGVSTGLRWWLKANAGTFQNTGGTTAASTDGDQVALWKDQSTVLNNASQATVANMPKFYNGIANGNPVLRFTGDLFLDGTSTPGIAANNSMHIFLVFLQNSYTGGGNDALGSFIIDRPGGTPALASLKMVTPDKYFYQKRNDAGNNLAGPTSNTSAITGIFTELSYYRNYNNSGDGYGIYINGRSDVHMAGDADGITAPILRIGRHATNTGGGLHGDLAEVIVYNTALSNTDRPKIESYLAIKYGITLDQTTATDYVNAAGVPIYPATGTHDNYDMNIAGIGRESASGLNQTASQSQNSQSMVKISNPSGLDDGEWLIWGNDSPVVWNSTDYPTGGSLVNRMSRVWRFYQTGDVGTFTVSFDVGGLGIDLSDPNKFALLTDSDGGFADATVWTTGRSISGNIITFTGISVGLQDFFSLACPLIPGPGGVAATTAWLRADEEVYTPAATTPPANNGLVQQWKTKNGSAAATATQATAANQPTYITGAANGNPVLRFSTSPSNKFMDFGSLNLSGTSDLQMTVVLKPTSYTAGSTGMTDGSYFFDRTNSTLPQIFALKAANTSKFALQEGRDAGGGLTSQVTTSSISTTTMQIVDSYRDYGVRFGVLYNGAQQGVLTESGGSLTLPSLRIGSRATETNGLDGDMAEVILFNRIITTAERNRIDSYLAIKYGITLDQVTRTNYTSSDGTAIYPATTSFYTSYVSDITGIGKDVVSRLTQTSSKSINSSAVVTITAASTPADLNFFVFGDNGGTLTTGTSAGVDGTVIKGRLSRVWRVAEVTGDVGDCTFEFDLSAVPGSKSQSDLRLLIDSDFDGFNDNDTPPMTGTLVGNIFTVTNVNMVNKAFFTIGTTDATNTTLPVRLTNFDVAIARNGIQATWRTQSELNNDYFTLLRSYDGEKFEEALRVPGAGTTDKVNFYEALDKPGTTGDIYYQLMQTDFDGKTSLSEIRKVSLKAIPFNVKIYPNPIDGSEFTTEIPVDNNIVAMEVLNAAGQVVYSGVAQGPVNNWNIGDLPRGIYFVKVISDTGADVQKLVLR